MNTRNLMASHCRKMVLNFTIMLFLIPTSSTTLAQSRPSDITTLRANDPNAKINLRSAASISSRKLGYGLPGDRVRVLGCETGPDRDRTPWVKVKFLQSGAIGWIRGDFVNVSLKYC